MAVAKDQIDELLEIIWDEVSMGGLERVLARFKKSVAYKKNKSFKDTVDRMIKRNAEMDET